MAKPQRKNFKRKREPKEFEEEVIQVDRVTRVTKGGRQLRFRATVVIGDKKGRVGYGVAKSSEVQGAIQKAVTKAKKSLIIVPIYEGTIPHSIQVKFKAAKVLIKPAGAGTGIIAGGAVRKMLDLAGVKNVLSKSLGSNNRLNTTKAAYKALSELRERPGLETDRSKLKKKAAAPMSRGGATIKTMSKKEAKEMSTADKRKMVNTKADVAKKDAAKKETSEKAAPAKKAPAKTPTKKSE
jgi:small subunit ribosomal protein S5